MASKFEIGQRIKEARLAKGYTQEALANLAGTQRQRVITWERGQHMPGSIYQKVLNNLLDVDLSDIDEEVQEMKSLLQRVEEIRARRPELGSLT